MNIRTFQPGDEEAQLKIYNEAAGALPFFKPASLGDIQRRTASPDFDPGTRFYATEGSTPVAYATFDIRGRVGYPWSRKGHESLAAPLFDQVIQALKNRGVKRAFAAYRGDWPVQLAFFEKQGFVKARDMVNFWLDPRDMPTTASRRSREVSAVTAADIPAIMQLAPQVFRITRPAELEKHLLHNPYFPADSLFAVRHGQDPAIRAVGVFVANPAYADARKVDSNMPCFRLGAFGTEGMQVKRINGLFSLLAKDNPDLFPFGLDLLGHAVERLERQRVECIGAQVASDVPHLLDFYQSYFKKQGSFPIYERSL